MIPTITPFYFPQHPAPIGLRKGHALCFLRGMNWTVERFEEHFRFQTANLTIEHLDLAAEAMFQQSPTNPTVTMASLIRDIPEGK